MSEYLAGDIVPGGLYRLRTPVELGYEKVTPPLPVPIEETLGELVILDEFRVKPEGESAA